MKKMVLVSAAISGLMLCSAAQAFDLEKKLLDYCEKAKSCAIKQIETEQIPEQYRAMVMANMKTMCVGVKQQFIPYLKEDPSLLNSAEACIDSLNQMSCDDLMSSERQTKACKSYSEMLEERESN